MTLDKTLMVLALLTEIMGAVFAALGILKNKAAKICDIAETRIGFNSSILRSEAEERAYVITGLAFLALGFVAQIVATIPTFRQRAVSPNWYAIGMGVLFLLLAAGCKTSQKLYRIFYVAACKEMVKRQLNYLGIKLSEETHRYGSLQVYAQLLDISFSNRDDEDVFQDICRSVGIVPPPLQK